MLDPAIDNRTPTATVRVRTGSRLHFGLLSTGEPFGGIGVMIADPFTEVTVVDCETFQPGPVETTRITAIAERIATQFRNGQLPRCRVEVTRLAPQHAGMGSGTQLSLAVADAICQHCGVDLPPEQLAMTIADRGKRSAVGLYGYFHGGLIFEADSRLASQQRLQQRVALPTGWTVIVVRPRVRNEAISGELESQQFNRLPSVSQMTIDRLRGQVEDDILPAAATEQFQPFADAVTRYNAASGELFRSVQGGPYNGPAVTSIVQWFKEQGVRGVGQSSWGPGVFAWFENRRDAEQVLRGLPNFIEPITITATKNHGRDIEQISSTDDKSPDSSG
jgi:beta-ribofuranosylaminobenzene 5'-phosphate synthase